MITISLTQIVLSTRLDVCLNARPSHSSQDVRRHQTTDHQEGEVAVGCNIPSASENRYSPCIHSSSVDDEGHWKKLCNEEQKQEGGARWQGKEKKWKKQKTITGAGLWIRIHMDPGGTIWGEKLKKCKENGKNCNYYKILTKCGQTQLFVSEQSFWSISTSVADPHLLLCGSESRI